MLSKTGLQAWRVASFRTVFFQYRSNAGLLFPPGAIISQIYPTVDVRRNV